MTYVEVVPSARFLEVLEDLSTLSDAPAVLKDFGEGGVSTRLNTLEVKWCHTKIKERGMPYRIHQLLNESEVVIPKYTPPIRSPELEARVQRLKAEQENKEYRKMTRNLIVNQYEAASLRRLGTDIREINIEMREMNRYLVTGAQYIVSIIGTFFAIFVGLSYAINDFGTRIILATICALAVALSEIYFIIRQDIDEEKVKEKRC